MDKCNDKWFNVFVEVIYSVYTVYFPFRYFVINGMCIIHFTFFFNFTVKHISLQTFIRQFCFSTEYYRLLLPDRQTDRYFIERKKVNPDLFVITTVVTSVSYLIYSVGILEYYISLPIWPLFIININFPSIFMLTLFHC